MEELLVKATNTYQWEAATLIYGPHPSLPSPWRVLACGPEELSPTIDGLLCRPWIALGPAMPLPRISNGLSHQDLVTGLQYGQAMLALKNTFSGDVSWATLDEVVAFVQGGSAQLVR